MKITTTRPTFETPVPIGTHRFGRQTVRASRERTHHLRPEDRREYVAVSVPAAGGWIDAYWLNPDGTVWRDCRGEHELPVDPAALDAATQFVEGVGG